MKSRFAIAALAGALAMPMLASSAAQAQYYAGGDHDYGRYSYNDEGAEDAPYYGDDYRYGERHRQHWRSYRGREARYYQDCRRSQGTTGLLAGGAGGALLGNAFGGGTLGTILGAVGGGLLGKELDKRHDAYQNYRNGC